MIKLKPRDIPVQCRICKGQCWDSKSQVQTQKNAFEKFGYIPNNCVNDSLGSKVHCPYA
jgi:hypothetical protein